MGQTYKHQDGESYWHATTRRDGLGSGCGGMGFVNCFCGGDLCVCGNFGETECYGCPDCESDDDEFEEEDSENAP